MSERSWLRILRAVQADDQLREMLDMAEVDSTDTILAMSDHNASDFRRGLEVMLQTKCPPSERWPSRIHDAGDKLDYLFAIVLASSTRCQEENEADLRRYLHTGATPNVGKLVQLRTQESQMGFGHHGRSRTPLPSRRGTSCIDNTGVPSLRAEEASLKAKWVQKLPAIHDRAGMAAHVTQDSQEAA